MKYLASVTYGLTVGTILGIATGTFIFHRLVRTQLKDIPNWKWRM